jgi:hypothetical protein
MYLNAPKPATSTLSTSAVGFMTSGANPKRDMTSKYAEAPPWPTRAYSKAAMKISVAAMIRVVVAIGTLRAIEASRLFYAVGVLGPGGVLRGR